MKIKYGLLIIFLFLGLTLIPGSVCAVKDSSEGSTFSISVLALDHGYVEVQAKSSSSSSKPKIKDGNDDDDPSGNSNNTSWWMWIIIGGIVLVVVIIAIIYFIKK